MSAVHMDEKKLTAEDLQKIRGSRAVKDRFVKALVWASVALALLPLLWVLITVVYKGSAVLFTSQPDFTRVCAVSKDTNDKSLEPYIRVKNSACTTKENGAKYRWVVGGKYVAVGKHLKSNRASVSFDPKLDNSKYVIGYPNSDEAGNIRWFSLKWWTSDTGATPDNSPGGGILHALIGSAWIGLICTLIAVPLGVLGAIFLVEYARGKKIAKVVSFMVDILTGVPSIVAALFIFAVFITMLGMHRSALASALALSLLMLPTVLRSTEEMLKLVPDGLREASYALGVPKWKTIISVIIPTAFTGIATGAVLGIARILGETAPLLILLNYARNLYYSPLSSSMGSLPTMIANAVALPEDYFGAERGWGAALTLILIVMGLNLLARLIARLTKINK